MACRSLRLVGGEVDRFALTALVLCPLMGCGSGGDGAARSSTLATASTVTQATSTTAPVSSTPAAVTSAPTTSVAAWPLAGDVVAAAINLADATVRWTTPKTDTLRGVSDVSGGDGLVVVRSGYCDNNVGVALNPTSGALLWRTDSTLHIDEINRAPGVPAVIAAGVVVMPTAGRLVGVDSQTGQTRWTSDIGQLAAESEAAVVLGHHATATSVCSIASPVGNSGRCRPPGEFRRSPRRPMPIVSTYASTPKSRPTTPSPGSNDGARRSGRRKVPSFSGVSMWS